VLQFEHLPMPTPGDHDVRIRVCASVVAAATAAFRSGNLLPRLYTGLLAPKRPVLGALVAGVVDAVGEQVTRVKVGDRVYGTHAEFGAHAEFLVLPEHAGFGPMPDGVTFEDAAAIVDGGATALPFLTVTTQVQPGSRVLINGASGATGVAAIQIARHLGAEVTAVCSTRNVELVRSLGAHHVVDYTKTDFTTSGLQYDVIFDTVAKRTFSDCKAALASGGEYLSTVPTFGLLLQVLWSAYVGDKKARIGFAGMRSNDEKVQDRAFLTRLVEAGERRAVIDTSFSMDQVHQAHALADTGHKRGSAVLRLSESAPSTQAANTVA